MLIMERIQFILLLIQMTSVAPHSSEDRARMCEDPHFY